MQIILASNSPRRKEIFSWLNLPFEVISPNIDENQIRAQDPVKLTCLLAQAKAQAVAKTNSEAIVLGSDAVVVLQNQILEKPHNVNHQRELLYLQRNQPAAAISAICLINTQTGKKIVQAKKTKYIMANLTDKQIEDYLKSGKGLDKAGGFGMQDEAGMFVGKILGCYTNLIGFPLCLVAQILQDLGVPIKVDLRKIVKEKTGFEC